MFRSNKTGLIYQVLIIAIVVVAVFACKKDEEETPPPSLILDTVYYNNFAGGTAQGWDTLTGEWIVEGGVLKVEHNDSIFGTSSALDTILTNYIFEVKATKISGDKFNIGIFLNGDPTELTPFGNWANSYKLVIGTHQWWRFGKLVNASYTQFALDSNVVALNPGFGAWNIIRVVVSGGKFEVFFNGTSMGVYTDNTFASGQAGISMFDEFYDGKAEYDYVMIANIPDGYQWGAAMKTMERPVFLDGFEGDKP